MKVIGAIETIADTAKSMSEVATFIEKLDNPDVAWRGECREAFERMRTLCKELKL